MESKDKRSDPAMAQTPAAGDSGTDERSGRVSYDARGNPVWEWRLETGVYSRDVSTQKLKKLDLGDLSIAETGAHKKPEGLEVPSSQGGSQGGSQVGSQAGSHGGPQLGGGFDPYDNSQARSRGCNPYDNAHAGAVPARTPEPAPAKRTPEDMRQLDAWIRQKKRIADGKDG